MNQINNAGNLFNGPFIISWKRERERERERGEGETDRERDSKQALNPTRMDVIPLKLPHQNSINTPLSGTLEGLK